MDASTPQWLSTSDAAWLLGVAPNTIRKLIDTGHMKGHRRGRVIRIRHCDIDEWLHRTLGDPDALEPTRWQPPQALDLSAPGTTRRGVNCRRWVETRAAS